MKKWRILIATKIIFYLYYILFVTELLEILENYKIVREEVILTKYANWKKKEMKQRKEYTFLLYNIIVIDDISKAKRAHCNEVCFKLNNLQNKFNKSVTYDSRHLGI